MHAVLTSDLSDGLGAAWKLLPDHSPQSVQSVIEARLDVLHSSFSDAVAGDVIVDHELDRGIRGIHWEILRSPMGHPIHQGRVRQGRWRHRRDDATESRLRRSSVRDHRRIQHLLEVLVPEHARTDAEVPCTGDGGEGVRTCEQPSLLLRIHQDPGLPQGGEEFRARSILRHAVRCLTPVHKWSVVGHWGELPSHSTSRSSWRPSQSASSDHSGSTNLARSEERRSNRSSSRRSSSNSA